MVKFNFILFFLVIFSAAGQKCDTYSFLKKGTEIEMSNYNAKGKLVSISKSKVLEINNLGGKTEAKVEAKSLNEKGKETFSTNLNVLCSGDKVSFSMKNMMGSDQMAGMKDMEMKVDETMLDYPSNFTVGNTLKDGNFKAEMYTGGMKIMTMNFNITNRKVVGQENVTTPAGEFNCYKITYSGNIKTIVNMNFDATEWYSPKLGLVKSETTRNGKSMGYSILSQTNAN